VRAKDAILEEGISMGCFGVLSGSSLLFFNGSKMSER
jgi:hypothetical protein